MRPSVSTAIESRLGAVPVASRCPPLRRLPSSVTSNTRIVFARLSATYSLVPPGEKAIPVGRRNPSATISHEPVAGSARNR